jgi:hypothetical protein
MTSGDPVFRSRQPVPHGAVLILGFAAVTALAFAAPASAQATAAAPTAAFDGEYTGYTTPTHVDDLDCDLKFGLIMTITAPRVRVASFVADRSAGSPYLGTIDASGRVSASKKWRYNYNMIDTRTAHGYLTGQINGGFFTGKIEFTTADRGGGCGFTVTLTKTQH